MALLRLRKSTSTPPWPSSQVVRLSLTASPVPRPCTAGSSSAIRQISTRLQRHRAATRETALSSSSSMSTFSSLNPLLPRPSSRAPRLSLACRLQQDDPPCRPTPSFSIPPRPAATSLKTSASMVRWQHRVIERRFLPLSPTCSISADGLVWTRLSLCPSPSSRLPWTVLLSLEVVWWVKHLLLI